MMANKGNKKCREILTGTVKEKPPEFTVGLRLCFYYNYSISCVHY